jgi:hypothetical protein
MLSAQNDRLEKPAATDCTAYVRARSRIRQGRAAQWR